MDFVNVHFGVRSPQFSILRILGHASNLMYESESVVPVVVDFCLEITFFLMNSHCL